MTNLIKRSLNAVLAVMVLLLAFALPATAQAAETWLPTRDFSADRAVYLDPALANDPTYPVSLNGLEAKLQDHGKKHGLKFYFVMAQQGTETNPTSAKFAPWKLDQLAGMIQTKLPSDDYVIVLLIRSNTDPTKFSFAANGGNRAQQFGLTGSFFDNTSIMTNARTTYLPNDPAGFANKTAAGINDAVDNHFAELKRQEEWRKQEEARRIAEIERKRLEAIRIAEEQRLKAIEDARLAEQWAKQKEIYIQQARLAGPPIGILILGGILFLVFRRKQSGLNKVLGTWREKITTSSEMYQRLLTGYFGFLEHQTAWEQKFKGSSLTQFKKAVTDFANYSARQIAANRRFQDADKLANGIKFPFIIFAALAAAVLALVNLVPDLFFIGLGAGLVGVIGLGVWLGKRFAAVHYKLSNELIVITGDELPLELATAFGGLIVMEEFKPGTVLDEIETLFDVTNKGLATIKDAIEGAEQNKKDIEALDAEMTALKIQLETTGLSFDAYALRYGKLIEGKTAFLAILEEDPLDAFTNSEEVETGFESLKADITRALGIQKSFAGTVAAIGKATQKVSGMRAYPVVYSYPLAGAETKGMAAEATYLLNEDGGPDTLIAQANEHFDNARKACLAGSLDKATDEKANAEKAAAEVLAMVDDILAAKALVERQVKPVRTNLGKLQGDIPSATTAVTELKSEFLAKNFPGEAEKLTTANELADSTDAELANVKKAYDEQRYLAARRRLVSLTNNIQHSIDELVEVHSRLAKLRQLKKHAKDTVSRATQHATALAAKLKSNAFTTSAQTDAAYATQTPILTAQQNDVGKDITDWAEAAYKADDLEAAYKAVDKAIDDQRSQHANAVSAVSALSAAISDATGYVRESDTRQPAKTKLAEANSALSSVEASIKVAKSDWAAIARQANDAKSKASEAKSLAQADKAAADGARSAISSARSNISGTRTSFNHGVTASLSSANSLLGQAERALSAGNYEDAKRLANQASSEADQAEREALARVAAIVAEIERQRRERERQEREAREARERQERADRQRREEASRSSSGGGGFGGGGHSGGGGFGGGGRSGGGGDF